MSRISSAMMIDNDGGIYKYVIKAIHWSKQTSSAIPKPDRRVGKVQRRQKPENSKTNSNYFKLFANGSFGRVMALEASADQGILFHL